MRQLARGFTLIELMVTLTITALLATAALPELFSYIANSRLRESANTLVATAALARNEAIKRNGTVSLSVLGQTLTVTKESDHSVLRTVQLPNGVAVTATKASFNSAGQLTPFGTTVTLATSLPTKTCSSSLRCPVVKIEAGGSANICSRGSDSGVCS